MPGSTPDNPQPRLTLFDLALTADDEPAIRAAVDGLKALGGPMISSKTPPKGIVSALAWRTGRAERTHLAAGERRSCSTFVPRQTRTPPQSRAGSKRPPG